MYKTDRDPDCNGNGVLILNYSWVKIVGEIDVGASSDLTSDWYCWLRVNR